jgi:ribonuclease HI
MIFFNLYTDGGARGNPGPAGCGAVLFDHNKKALTEKSLFIGKATNNFAEYTALIIGLDMAREYFMKENISPHYLYAHLDSELVQKQLCGLYKVKHKDMIPLFLRVKECEKKCSFPIEYKHIPRKENSYADSLANKAMDEKSL